MLLGNPEDLCNQLWFGDCMLYGGIIAMQHSRGCTRDCQLGRMCVLDVDLRKESSREEDRYCLYDRNTRSHMMGELWISTLYNSSWGLK